MHVGEDSKAFLFRDLSGWDREICCCLKQKSSPCTGVCLAVQWACEGPVGLTGQELVSKRGDKSACEDTAVISEALMLDEQGCAPPFSSSSLERTEARACVPAGSAFWGWGYGRMPPLGWNNLSSLQDEGFCVFFQSGRNFPHLISFRAGILGPIVCLLPIPPLGLFLKPLLKNKTNFLKERF